MKKAKESHDLLVPAERPEVRERLERRRPARLELRQLLNGNRRRQRNGRHQQRHHAPSRRHQRLEPHFEFEFEK